MILFEIIKFLVALIIIAILMVVLVAVIMGAWETYFKNEQAD